ncbi:hypothetical protein STEG23_023992, partial [Scotinomys teguina]
MREGRCRNDRKERREENEGGGGRERKKNGKKRKQGKEKVERRKEGRRKDMRGWKRFIYMVYYIDRLSYVKPSLHLWDKAYLVMVDNVFDVFLELVCQYFIEYFCIYVHEGDCLDKGLSVLLIFSKNQLFVSLILCIVFFVSILLISVFNLIISLRLFLLGDFASSSSRAFSFDLVYLSIGWNLPSSAFCKAGFVDRLGLFIVSQISWTFCFMTFLDLVFSLTDESISSVVVDFHSLSQFLFWTAITRGVAVEFPRTSTVLHRL